MTNKDSGKASLAYWFVLLVTAGLLFRRTLAVLFDRWWTDDTYSHGLLVPLVSVYFLVRRAREHGGIEIEGSLWGAAGLVGAVLVFLAGRLGNMLFAQAVGFIAALASLVLLICGREALKVAILPILYLFFMCPIPSGLYDYVSAHLRLFASNVSTILLQIAGVPAAASGNIIYIPNATLSVEDACSGIRSLFGIAATATAFAFVVRGGSLRKVFLIASTVPIAIFTNILRVTGTGILQNAGYAGLAEGFYHHIEGWMFYVLALAILLVEYAVLDVVFPTGPRGADEPGRTAAAAGLRWASPAGEGVTFHNFALAAFILACGLAGQWKLDAVYAAAARRSVEARVPFDQFPRIVGPWRATFKDLTDRELQLLHVDDYLHAEFSGAEGGGISVYAGYYRNPDRATQHPPTICYPGAGWLKTYDGRTTLSAGAKPVSVQETLFERAQQRTLVIYWYEVAGYSGADASWQKVVRLGRLLSGKGVTGAMKVQIAIAADGGRLEAERRLEGFLMHFVPVLERFGPND